MELGRIGESCLFQYRISELFCQNKHYSKSVKAFTDKKCPDAIVRDE